MHSTKEKLETSHIRILESSLRHKQVSKLAGTLELIAICKSHIQREMNLCDEMYGRSITGERLGNQNSSAYIARYMKVGDRLKKYYDSQLEKLTKYKNTQ